MNKICLIGNYPPPTGGRNIHIKNLAVRLIQEGYETEVLDLAGRKGNSLPPYVIEGHRAPLVVKKLLDITVNIYHFHNSSWRFISIYSLLARLLGKKVLITVHSFRIDFKKESWAKRCMIMCSLHLANQVICVGKEVEKMIKLISVKENVVQISPYIKVRTEHSDTQLPAKILNFMKGQNKIIVANASANSHYLGNDLYGIDMCVNLCAELLERNISNKFIYILTKVTDSQYLHKIMMRIEHMNLSSNFLLYVGNVDFIALLRKADLFVRPTSSDSFGISVLEALVQNVPTVASDTCDRPKGTVVFPSRNQHVFNNLCANILLGEEKVSTDIEVNDNAFDGFLDLRKFYNSEEFND